MNYLLNYQKLFRKKNYDLVSMLAEKQYNFMQRVNEIWLIILNTISIKSWRISLEKHKNLIKIIENDLKDLNSKTKNCFNV